jgi:hypothetical protein
MISFADLMTNQKERERVRAKKKCVYHLCVKNHGDSDGKEIRPREIKDKKERGKEIGKEQIEGEVLM